LRLQTPSMVTTRRSTKRSATMPTTTPNVTTSMSVKIYIYTPQKKHKNSSNLILARSLAAETRLLCRAMKPRIAVRSSDSTAARSESEGNKLRVSGKRDDGLPLQLGEQIDLLSQLRPGTEQK
jgi:hypothetical protein